MQTCRGSHTHTLRARPERPGERLRLRLGHERACARRTSWPGARRRRRTKDPNTSLFRIEVIKVPLAAPQDAKVVSSPRIFADAQGNIAGLWQGGAHGDGTQSTARDRPVPRHHRLPGDRPGGGRVLGQRHPARHPRPGQPEAHRRGERPELRLLALGDVQQRRQEGAVHRRVGRRHAAALPRDRPAEWGADAIFTIARTQAAARRATTSCRRRRRRRRTASRTTAR